MMYRPFPRMRRMSRSFSRSRQPSRTLAAFYIRDLFLHKHGPLPSTLAADAQSSWRCAAGTARRPRERQDGLGSEPQACTEPSKLSAAPIPWARGTAPCAGGQYNHVLSRAVGASLAPSTALCVVRSTLLLVLALLRAQHPSPGRACRGPPCALSVQMVVC